ncbi:hypothetical protein ABC955_01510 [Citromicrobium bathyomarinum]
MSSGNRSKLGQAGLAVAALASLLFGGGLWYWANTEETHYQIAAERDAQYEADAARKRVQLECAVSEIPRAECNERIQYEAQEAQERTRDLEAQQSMSVWTKAMGIAAVIGMAVGIFGLGLIFFTFRETRRAADAGFRANEIASENAQRDGRAYMVVNRYYWNVENDVYQFGAEWMNVGKSPTRKMRTYISYYLSDDPLPDDFDFPVDPSKIGTAHAGPGSHPFQGAPAPEAGIPIRELTAVKENRKYLYVYGWVRYFDIFDGTPEHVTKFCTSPRVTTDFEGKTVFRFVQLERHNCADEGCDEES